MEVETDTLTIDALRRAKATLMANDGSERGPWILRRREFQLMFGCEPPSYGSVFTFRGQRIVLTD